MRQAQPSPSPSRSRSLGRTCRTEALGGRGLGCCRDCWRLHGPAEGDCGPRARAGVLSLSGKCLPILEQSLLAEGRWGWESCPH